MPDPATERRVIFSSYVIPQESLDLEEGTTKYTIESSCGRPYGGKGLCTDLADEQWGEAWISFAGSQQYWEDWDDDWEDVSEAWNGVLSVSSGAVQLNSDYDTRAVSVKFCYIKNLGTAPGQELRVTLNATHYNIIIPANGSIAFRGDGTNVIMEDVKVKRKTNDTEVEFVIAK